VACHSKSGKERSGSIKSLLAENRVAYSRRTVLHVVSKYIIARINGSNIYGTRMFLTAFTSTRHLSLS